MFRNLPTRNVLKGKKCWVCFFGVFFFFLIANCFSFWSFMKSQIMKQEKGKILNFAA